jgi:hypothetical protein
MRNRIAVLGLVAAVAATGGLAVAGTSALAADDDHPQGAAPGTAAKAAPAVIKCDGGGSVNLRSRIVNTPFTFAETGTNAEDQAVPGAQLALKGPHHGTDTLLVTFSAETQVTGGTPSDWMGLEVHLDGTPINPYTAAGDVLAFTGEPSWNSNSMQFCTKVGPGNHVLKTYANLMDNSGVSLNGWLDDYTFSVQRFR